MPEEETRDSSVHNFGVRFVLEGDGPWALDLPAGELQLDVRDEEGEHIEASVIAGEHVAEIHGPTTLRRLRPGPQRIFVSADDHRSAIIEVSVPESGCVPVEVVLPQR